MSHVINQTCIPGTLTRITPRFRTRAKTASVVLGLWLGLLATIWAGESTNAPLVVVTCDHADGVYSQGQSILWRVELQKEATNLAKINYALKQGGLTILRQGKLELTNGAAEMLVTNVPCGTMLLEVKTLTDDGLKSKVVGGAVISPENIQPSAPRPEDFDAFWQSKIKELSKIPPDPQLIPIASEKAGVDYWQLNMSNIWGTRVRAQLARRSTGEKFPAMMIMEGAGVHGLKKGWVTSPAAKGWLALNVSPHDLPIDESTNYYDNQSTGALKDYWVMGNENRNKSYFLKMYLGCYRAAQYLTERPDWDGKTLVMIGTSQGGMQALMTAGLHPKVTAVIACVPAGSDMTGPQVGRSPGWPQWYFHVRENDPTSVIQASRYFDIVNFASRIKCPVLTGIGLIDETCPAAGILAAMNQVKAPKEIVLLPHSDHMGMNNSQQAFHERSRAWQKALLEGQPVPPGK